LLSLVCFIRPPEAQAISQFTTQYNIHYQINSNGNTHVTYNIEQKNNLSSIYATDFSLSLSQTNIRNIKIVDDNVSIKPEISTTDNLTNISFPFANQVAGKDKIHSFSISFDSQDIASKIGSIWEVNIPHLNTGDGESQQSISFTVPPELPEPAFINPYPNRIDKNTYYFTQSTLANRSISAVFGQEQYFQFTLFYNLENPTGTNATTTIALPPDTPYQQLFYQKIDPQPESVSSDLDGNWLASIKVLADSNLQLRVDGVVKIRLKPRSHSLENKDLYLQPTEYWPSDNSLIEQTASKLKTAENIFNYVYDKLDYDYSRLQQAQKRLGGLSILDNPQQAICTDYTDLFIALARSQAIPARELQGFAFSDNDKLRPLNLSQDILHSWPEYYDQNQGTWIQVDPTWTDTTQGIDYFHKLDLNHFVFVIHGQNPHTPYPAGAYKSSNSNSKDIFVTPTTPVDFPVPQVIARINSVNSNSLTLDFENDGQVGFSGSVKITDPIRGLDYTTDLNLPIYSSQTVKISLKENSVFKNTISQVTIKTDDQTISLPISYPQTFSVGSPTQISLVILVILGTAFAGGLYFRRRRRQNKIPW